MATTTFVNGSTLSDAGWANDADTSAYMALTSVSGSNTIAATGPANYSFTSRHPISWIQATTNTAATTLNITPSGGSALGAKNLFARGGACVGGELLGGMAYQAVYDGTQYQLIGNSAFLGVATATSISFGGSALSTYSESSYTATLTGCTTSPTYTVKYTKVGNAILMQVPATTGTSNATTKSLTGAPAAVQPGTQQRFYSVWSQDNSGSFAFGSLAIETSGVMNFYYNTEGAWTAGGTFTTRTISPSYQLA